MAMPLVELTLTFTRPVDHHLCDEHAPFILHFLVRCKCQRGVGSIIIDRGFSTASIKTKQHLLVYWKVVAIQGIAGQDQIMVFSEAHLAVSDHISDTTFCPDIL